MSSIGEELPKEMARVREMIPIYDSVPMGFIAANMMRNDLDRAATALADGNIVEIIRVYECLKGYTL